MFCGISSDTGMLAYRHGNHKTPRSLLTEEFVRSRSAQDSRAPYGLRPDGCSTQDLPSVETPPSVVATSVSSLSIPTPSPIVVQDTEMTPTRQNPKDTNLEVALGSLKVCKSVLNHPALSISESLAPTKSLSGTESQPNSEVCSPTLKPLTQRWHFPLHEALYKSTPGALDGLTQEEFEHLVTKGTIIEDEKGFQWAANHRYLLYKSREEISHSTPSGPRAGNQANNGTCHVQSLFSRPSLTQACYTDSIQQLDTDPASPGFRPIYQRRGIRKLPNPIPATDPVPLPSPWRFPSDALYAEAFPDATRRLSHSKIESMVTRGLLIACPTGIRDAGTDLYRLFYVGERDKSSKQHVPRITKCRAVGHTVSAEKPPTPIVEEVESAIGMMMTDKSNNSKKTVRFSHRLRCLDPRGGGRSEKIRDNEGLSSSLAKDVKHDEKKSAVDARLDNL